MACSVTTLPGSLKSPCGAAAAADEPGAWWVCDSANDVVLKVGAGGAVLATVGERWRGATARDVLRRDGPARTARFDWPAGVAVMHGVVYIADFYNGCIRALHPDAGGPVRALGGRRRIVAVCWLLGGG